MNTVCSSYSLVTWLWFFDAVFITWENWLGKETQDGSLYAFSRPDLAASDVVPSPAVIKMFKTQ